jgi:3-hydroxyanthranilate 3,4-dioxygenase
MLSYGMPLNLNSWIDQVRDKLRPPVGNQQIWANADIITTVVGSPNERTDFHDDPYEELFYQIKGDAFLLILDRGKFARINLREGDVFLLPAHVRHSPQRPGENTLCIVVERARPVGTLDAFEWYCASCASLVHRLECQLISIVSDLPKLYNQFYDSSAAARTCRHCGTVHSGRDAKAWLGPVLAKAVTPSL